MIGEGREGAKGFIIFAPSKTNNVVISQPKVPQQLPIFDVSYSQLGWPKRNELMHPPGRGPELYADLVRRKIKNPLQRFDASANFDTGILAADPSSHTSDAPLAIICEFASAPHTKTLLELHKLAWNFCYSPLLITLEPGLLRAWNCCEKPADDPLNSFLPLQHLMLAEHRFGDGHPSLAQQTAVTLHWINLITGGFLRRKEEEGRLKPDRRADRTLLENLKFIRQRLLEVRISGQGISQDTCHDLLARVIFVQFLCERKDSEGNTALGPTQFYALHDQGRLSKPYQNFEHILASHADTYALFRFLNQHFNGDLFPGKGLTRSGKKAAWQNEMNEVKSEHLLELVKLLDGRLQAENNQLCLWRHYSFDTIPLEFISSIYEEFVTKRRASDQELEVSKPARKKEGVVYTPGHLVDFVLDRVLPWGDTNWNLKILDPACGSGIFLVKAFRRLMHRWQLANPGKPMEPRFPRRLLERNIFGVDIDTDAVRVASFSLYLAMLDELDPKLYFRRTKFPVLYSRRLIAADFFSENREGFKTNPPSRRRYDLVIGNAPWGEDMMTDTADAWAKKYEWPVADKNVGPLFLAKALTMVKANGRVAVLEPAGALLVNHNSTQFRQRLFSDFKLDSVFNFAPLSRVLFEKADSPCVLPVLRPVSPDDEPFYYCSPKRQQSVEDKYRIVIEPYDAHWVYQSEVQGKDEIWSALLWGGRRDVRLIHGSSMSTSLRDLQMKQPNDIFIREGFIRGKSKRKSQSKLKGRRVLETDDFPANTFLELRAKALKTTDDLMVHERDSTNFRAFDLPQLIIKQSWTKTEKRFRAVTVVSDPTVGGIVCKQSYVSVSAKPHYKDILDAACLLFNSKFAVYLLLLKSGRFAFYRTEPLVEDLLALPVPPPRAGLIEGLKSFDDVDKRVREAFSLDNSEWQMVEDLCKYSLPDYRGDASSPGYQPTSRALSSTDPSAHSELADYCRSLIQVLRTGFGEDKAVCATVYHETDSEHLAIRLVAVHLDWPGQRRVRFEALSNNELYEQMKKLTDTLREDKTKTIGGYQGRTARVYSSIQVDGRQVPTVVLLKPDQHRFWTRSIAVRDADTIALDIMMWRGTTPKTEPRLS